MTPVCCKMKVPVRPFKRSAHFFDSHVAGRAFHVSHAGQHLAFAGSFKVAVKLFVNCHPAKRSVAVLIVCLRHNFYFKRSTGVIHGGTFLKCGCG